MVWTLKAHPRFEGDLKKLSNIDKGHLEELLKRIKENVLLYLSTQFTYEGGALPR